MKFRKYIQLILKMHIYILILLSNRKIHQIGIVEK